MQYDSLRAFPYPVLRPDIDDYLDGELQATVDIKPSADGSQITAEVQFALSVKEIVDLVKQKKATYTVVFACRDTYFRQAYNHDTPHFEVPFPVGTLRGEVLIYPYVIAATDIAKYKCGLINKEFGNGPFVFTQGSVLALDRPQSVYIDRDVFNPITSVFSLIKKEEITGHEWQLNVSGDRVLIAVSPALKERIDAARNTPRNKAVLLNSIYFAAVMQCVGDLQKHKDEYEHSKWAQVILQKCHNIGINIEQHESYFVTQRLMKYPVALIDTYLFGESGND